MPPFLLYYNISLYNIKYNITIHLFQVTEMQSGAMYTPKPGAQYAQIMSVYFGKKINIYTLEAGVQYPYKVKQTNTKNQQIKRNTKINHTTKGQVTT